MNPSTLIIFLISKNKSVFKKEQQSGFTLIELLVVVIITGILASVALPSMLRQATRAKEASARNNIGAVNRSQQAYRLENPSFSNDMNGLNINVPLGSNGYSYSFGTTSSVKAEFRAISANNDLQIFTGCALASNTGNDTITSTSIEVAPPGSPAPSC